PFLNQSANLLNSIGKPALCFAANAVSLLINLVVNYLCLLQFGLYGAAIGTLITHVVGTVGWYFIMKREVGFSPANVFRHALEVYTMVWGILLKLKKGERDLFSGSGQATIQTKENPTENV
ncbi:MAG: polysaccharide biosynthesis C-terminal domain-containing protein, partial [Bacteroidota bacterium]